MRVRRVLAASVGALGIGILAASCGATGELIVAIQTDMSMPKDIDSIEIEAKVNGVIKYDNKFTNIGRKNGDIKLPATLALLAPEEAASPVTLQVVGRKNTSTRVVREVVTTIPESRVATLNLKLESLCVGFGKEDRDTGEVSTGCADGETCIAGSCKTNELSSDEFPTYSADEIFGGGTGQGDGSCFDVTKCFIGAKKLEQSASNPCTFAPPDGVSDFNIALLTEITGMCGAASCLVALDAGNASGWTQDKDGVITLPAAVCDPTGPTITLGVVYAPTTPECPRKTAKLPTCGSWSSSGTPTDPEGLPPLFTLANSQAYPVSLFVDDTGVYWTNSGVMQDGALVHAAVKRADLDGGGLGSVEVPDATPRGVAVGTAEVFFTSVGTKQPTGEVRRLLIDDFSSEGAPSEPLAVATSSPEGIAIARGDNGDTVLWTDFGSLGSVRRVTLDTDGKIVDDAQPISGLLRPTRIVANERLACWTNEGTLNLSDGSVVCEGLGGVQGNVKGKWPDLPTPRAVALAGDDTVYWATFTDQGTVYEAKRSGSAFLDPTVVATMQSYPNGIAVDKDAIYWTNWGDGTVWMQPRMAGAQAEKIAEGQVRPSMIAVHNDVVYWINEGMPGAASGSVIRFEKP